MTLHPQVRSNIVFAVAFFLTRILFHIILGVSYFLHDNRTQILDGSFVPSILLAMIFPLHAMWFYGCIQGFMKRAASRHTPVSTILDTPPVDQKVNPPPEPQSKRTLRSRPSSKPVDNQYNARSANTTPSPTFSNYDSKLERSKLHSRRFYSRSLSLSSNDSRSSVTGRLRTKLYASLPNREVVFDYVGLGRGSPQEQWLNIPACMFTFFFFSPYAGCDVLEFNLDMFLCSSWP